jgi:uncharacterized membrane protein
MKPGNTGHDVVLRQAAAMGFVAGLRSQIPFLMLVRAAGKNGFATGAERPLSWLRHPQAQTLLFLAAAGEVVVDKLPFIPSRTDPGPLLGRLAFGAAAGAAIAVETHAPLAKHAAVGAASALVGSFAGRFGRAIVVRTTGLPDLVVALAEDGLAFWLGDRVMRPRCDPPAFRAGAPGQPNASRA